ncbi:MAG: hypothetical protein RI922_1327 [Bacteroidota bacterium]
MNQSLGELIKLDRNYLFFTPLDILATVFTFSVLLIIIYYRSRKNREKTYYKYILPAFLFKGFFVLANVIYYINYGGDTIAFWDGAVKLNNLFWHDPYAYFSELIHSPEGRSIYENFTLETGYPDSSIYAEPQSYFISKITSVFSLFSYKGYMSLSLIFGFFTTLASFRLYELIRNYKLHSDWHLALAIFFIPSLSFWCGGISKDTVVFVAICYFLHNLFQILSVEAKGKWKHWLSMIICLYVILQVRSFILLGIAIPLLFAFSAALSKRFEKRKFEKYSIRLIFLTIIAGAFVVFFTTSISDDFVKEASVINQDMTTNKTYGTNRYSLGEVDYSPIGMVVAAPMSILAGFYRPYIWEALSVSLILNGLESIVLIYFTFRFFASRKIGQRIKRIRKHEFLIFAFFFAVILAYFAGFTSILFGVLVRFKAPVLPFLVILLTSYYMEEHLDTSASREYFDKLNVPPQDPEALRDER